MSYFTWKEDKCSTAGRATRWTSHVPDYSKTIAFLASESPGDEVDVCSSSRSEERASPEGFGASAGDAQRTMSCQRTVKSLAGQFGGLSGDNDRFSSGTGPCGLGAVCDVGARREEEDRKVSRCDKCSLTLVALKKQALSLLVHQHFCSKDLAAMSTFLHTNLRVHNSRSTADPREKDRDHGLCMTCGVHLNQLKQEAVQLALSRENSRWPGHSSPEHSSGPPPPNPNRPELTPPATVTGTGSPRRLETGQYGHKGSREMPPLMESEVTVVPQQYSFTHGYASPQTFQRDPGRIQDHPQDQNHDTIPQRNLETTLDQPQERPQDWTTQRTLERPKSRTPQRHEERNPDNPQDNPKDRTLDRPQKRTPQHAIEHPRARPQDHHQDQTPQWTQDCPQTRTPQRTPVWMLEHPQQHPQNRTPQRTLERILDNQQERPYDCHQYQTSQWNLDRPQYQSPQRNPERILDHPKDQTLDRSRNRTPQRTLEQTLHHPVTQHQHQPRQRSLERILDHPQDRTLDRPKNRTRHRSLERILDPPKDRHHDRHQDQAPQWTPEQTLNRPQDRTQNRTPQRTSEQSNARTTHWNSEQTLNRTTPQRTLNRTLDRPQTRSPLPTLDPPQNRTPQRTLDRTRAHWKSEQTLNHTLDRPKSSKTPQQTPERTPQTLRRRGPRPLNPDMNRWVAEQQQLVAVVKSVAAVGGNGGDVYPYQAGGGVPEGCGGGSPKMAHIARVATIANSAAMAFLARAAQKLNLRRKGSSGGPGGTGRLGHHSTCFRGLIEKNPPPIPPFVFQNGSRTRELQNTGQVKVILRVCPPSPMSSEGPLRAPLLRIDPSRKRVTVVEPTWNSLPRAKLTQRREERALLKTYAFDTVYPQETGQAEVCAGVLTDVIRGVVGGADACVLGLGCVDPGSWSSMVGSDENHQKLGVVPCSIPWLYGAIERWKERTWTSLSVSVSAVELRWGGPGGAPGEGEESLRDLLAEVAPAARAPGRPAAHVHLQEDPLLGVQLRNHNRVKCPTAERAASLLDSAIASRLHGNQAESRGGYGDDDMPPPVYHSSVMFFTMHVQPPRTDLSTNGKAPRAPSRLTMIDVCSSMKMMTVVNKTRNELPQTGLPSVLFSLLTGNRNIPSKGSKLTMLLKESLGRSNCLTTVIAQVSDLPVHLPEALSTIYLVSRIRRAQKRPKQSTSCSPCGRSLGKDRRQGGHRSAALRSFHSTGQVGVDAPRLRRRGDPDERSISDQSCDTVIHIGSDGAVHDPKSARRLPLTRPPFVPIVPSLHRGEPATAADDPEFTALLVELLKIPQSQQAAVEQRKEKASRGKMEPPKVEAKPPERDCLKCETFAELQERLGCIDGSEAAFAVDAPEPKHASVDASATETRPQKDAAAVVREEPPMEAPKTPQGLGRVGQEYIHAPPVPVGGGEKKSDGAAPDDAFQREDSGLYDCEDGSAASSAEEPQNHNQSLGRARVLRANRSGTPDPPTPRSSSDSSEKEEPRGNSPAPAPRPAETRKVPDDGEWVQPEFRTSPIGKSYPISPPSTSSPSPPSLAKSVLLGGLLPHLPTEELKELKATITVTVQQPLDRDGRDEIVYSVVEEVTISGALDRDVNGRSVLRIRESATSPSRASASAACSQPIRIISNVAEDSGTAEGCGGPVDPSVRVPVRESGAQPKPPPLKFRKENKLLPSFINPMLLETDCVSFVDGDETRYTSNVFFAGREPVTLEHGRNDRRKDDLIVKNSQGNVAEKRALERGAFAFEIPHHEYDRVCTLPLRQMSCDSLLDPQSSTLYNETRGKHYGERQRQNVDRHCSRGAEPVYPPAAGPQGQPGGRVEAALRGVTGNGPGGIAASLGCLATVADDVKTNSLPRGWQSARPGEGRDHRRAVGERHGNDERRGRAPPTAGMTTSSTPSSPRVTMERRHRRHPRPRHDGLDGISPPPQSKTRHPEESRQESNGGDSGGGGGGGGWGGGWGGGCSLNRKARSLFRSSSKSWSPSKRSDSLNGLKSAAAAAPEPTGGWNLGARLRQLTRRTGSLGRTPAEFKALDRGNSTASVSSRASSRASSKASSRGSAERGAQGSYEEVFKGKGGKRSYEGESTLARNSRSPKKSPRCGPAFEHDPSGYPSPQSPRSASSKLSAVGKLKMATPKARRLSNSGTRTLSFSRSDPRRSAHRSASLSPEGGRALGRGRASCFPSLTSSSPPWSIPSLSRTQSQSSSCGSTKSPIHGVIDGRFSDFLKDRDLCLGPGAAPTGPTKGRTPIEEEDDDEEEEEAGEDGLFDGVGERPYGVPSPYSRLTAPRAPAHLSGHGSDVTSVLSGELPPAMGKTALLVFPKRSSAVSSGYGSLARDGEAPGDRGPTADQGSTLRRGTQPARRRGYTGEERGMMN